jgi:hypothetical protein
MNFAVSHGIRVFAAASVVALSLGATQASASAQDDAEDIRDKPLDKVERKLSDRGYERVRAGGGTQFWWNRSNEHCLEVHVNHDRVSHAEVRDEKQCREASKHGQSHAASSSGHGFSSMIGMRASNLDGEMQSRGFAHKGGHQSNGASHTTWWNRSSRECLTVATRDGRVDTVQSIAEGNCN